MAYVDGRGCWEINVYDEVADAMRRSAGINDVAMLGWGMDSPRHKSGIQWSKLWIVTLTRRSEEEDF